MLIILEGCDGVGKSTLAERLVASLEHLTPTRVELLHRGPITEHPLREYELPLDDYRPGGDRHVICDRWHIGEAIYGPMYRGKSQLTRADRLHIELFLAGRGALLVLMTQMPNVIRERLKRRGDDMVTEDQVDEIAARYLDVSYEACMPVVHARGCSDDVVLGIIGEANAHEVFTETLNRFPTYVGPIRPHFLILGERRNERKSEGHSSAFVPYPGTSGRYLLDALPTHVAWACGIANAMEEDVHALWQTLGEPRVLTLGNEAHRELLQLEMEHGAAPHPQYVRRFHHRQQVAYGRTLANALLHQEDMTSWRP